MALLLAEAIAITTGVAALPIEDWQRLFLEVYQADSRLGFKPKPNLEDFIFVSRKQFGIAEIINTDNYGFRNFGKDYTNTNLYFIGDSFTWGQGVSRERTFYGLIESTLKQPVITLGVPAYGFEQYEVLFQDWVAKYQPKTVVLSVFANDLHTLNRQEDFNEFLGRMAWHWYKNTISYRLFSQIRSPVFMKRATNGIHMATIRSFASQPDVTGGIGADIDYLTSNTHLEVEAALSRIIDLTQKNQIKFFLFLLPSKESTYIQEYTKLFKDKVKYVQIEEAGYERLCNLADSRGVPCVDLTQVFRQHSQNEPILYFDVDSHWSVAGHKLASQLILDTLQKGHGVDLATDRTKVRDVTKLSTALHEQL